MDKSPIWKNSGSRDMKKNAPGESDCRIFKSVISLEQNDEKEWFFASWYKFIVIVVINGCAHSGHRTLNLAVSHEEINGVDWISVRINSGKLKGCVHYIFASLCLGLNESTCQIKKNVFYFTSKPLFVLEKMKF